jgi:Cu(I)/Ag(I) efflux system membrane fusion protein
VSNGKWILVTGIAVVIASGGAYQLGSQKHSAPAASAPAATASTTRAIAYYQHPGGKPDYSPDPKNDEQGRPYLPVYEEQPATEPAKPAQKAGRILYYRHPMGLGDVSPVPKKDSMGMDYVAVYQGDEPEAGTIKVSLEKMQRLGVQTEAIRRRSLTYTVRAVGTIQFDERSRAVVTTRYEGWVEQLPVNTTGQPVRKGEILLGVYSPELVQAQQDYLAAISAQAEMTASGNDGAAAVQRLVEGSLQRLRNLDYPEGELARLREQRTAARVVTVVSPITGVVIEKMVQKGQRVMMGEPLYQLAATDPVWLVADVFEQDLGLIRTSQKARVTVPAYPGRTFLGDVSFIYPMLNPDTRTARIRIEIGNPSGDLKTDMYAAVEIDSPVSANRVLAVPDSAVLDSGVRKVVFVEREPGRFQPRDIKVGARGDGFVSVLEGVNEGERVVVRANFLIDAESNMRAALQSFTAPGGQQ